MTKALEKPQGWQMLVPRAAQNLQRPHARDWQGRQMPRSGAGGWGAWVQLELTDALIERPSKCLKELFYIERRVCQNPYQILRDREKISSDK